MAEITRSPKLHIALFKPVISRLLCTILVHRAHPHPAVNGKTEGGLFAGKIYSGGCKFQHQIFAPRLFRDFAIFAPLRFNRLLSTPYSQPQTGVFWPDWCILPA